MFILYSVVIGVVSGSSSADEPPVSPTCGSAGHGPSSSAWSSSCCCSHPADRSRRRARPADLRGVHGARRPGDGRQPPDRRDERRRARGDVEPGRHPRERRVHAGRSRRDRDARPAESHAYSNSVITDHAALRPLTDIFALPTVGAVRERLQHRRRHPRHRCGRRDRGGDARCIHVSIDGDRRSDLTAGASPRRCAGALTRRPRAASTDGSCARARHSVRSDRAALCLSARTVVQGKPVARRGRKTRDLTETARLPPPERHVLLMKGATVKANLARFTWALTLLAIMALSTGAGMRWDWG